MTVIMNRVKLLSVIMSMRNVIDMKKQMMKSLIEFRPELVNYEDRVQLKKLENQLEELIKEAQLEEVIKEAESKSS